MSKLGKVWQSLPSILLIGTVLLCIVLVFIRRTDDVVVLRWAHVYETSSPYHAEALRAADEFYDRTDGRYRIRVFPASSLGNEVSINEGLQLGSIDIIYTGASLAGQYFPPLGISDYPYAITDLAHWQAYRTSDLFRELKQGYSEATGQEILSLVYYGFRHVISNVPVETPEDMRNMKIRVPQSRPFMIMPERVGANPTPLPFQEVYLGLQQGVVEAAENPLTTIYYKKFYEVQTHISLTGHIANSLVIVGSGQRLAEMTDKDKFVFHDVINAASDRAINAIITQEEELVDWYTRNGITVVTPDRQAFIDKVTPALYETGLPFSPEQFERLQRLRPSGD